RDPRPLFAAPPRARGRGPRARGRGREEPEGRRKGEGYDDGIVAIAEVAGELVGAAANEMASTYARSNDVFSARLAREIGQVLHLVQSVAVHRLDPAAAPLLDFYREVAAVEVPSGELDEIARISLRQQLFGGGL